MTTVMSLPGAVVSRLEAWLDAHDRLAPGLVEGLYVVGSASLDDWRPTSDIDIVGFVADPTDVDTVGRLRTAHDADRAAGSMPTVDGPLLAWADVSTPPVAAQRPWTLDGDFRFDGECFEMNPVTWFTLSTYGIPLRGPAPGQLEVRLDVDERRTWVRENVATYWSGLGRQIERSLVAEPGREDFDSAMTEWCALGIARMAYTWETGDVTSKSGAGRWAAVRYRDHRTVLDRALSIRERTNDSTVDRATVDQVSALIGDVVADIAG